VHRPSGIRLIPAAPVLVTRALVTLLAVATALAVLPPAQPAAAEPVEPVQAVQAPSAADAHAARLAAARLQRHGDLFAAPGAIPGEVLVTYADGGALQRDVAGGAAGGWRAAAAPGFTRARRIADRVALVTVDAADAEPVLAALAADPDVVAVEPNVRREYAAVPDDTSYGHQWAHQQTRIEQAWDVSTGDGAIAPLIAILDSGIDATHPDLQPNVVQSLRSVDGSIIPGAPDNDPCGIGHGTAVAGVAAARGDDGFGVAGVLWRARVIDIALTSPENGCPGGPSDADTITAMNHVSGLAEKPWAMNLSLGASLSGCTAAYQAAADQAFAAGIVVVAAAGNDGSSSTSIPASCDRVLSVAATTASGARASYSQTNPQVDIAAPGGDIEGPLTSCPSFDQLVSQFVITTSLTSSVQVIGGCPEYTDPNGHRLQGISGTSFSAPYVAGAVGLLRQLAADQGAPLGVEETEAVLEGTSRDAGATGRDCEFGWGILDMQAAVQAVQSGAIPALQPDSPPGQGGCSGAGPAPGGDFTRIAAGTGDTTDAVAQAVAISSFLPAGVAPYAVLARVDDFADALAGSAVGLGLGPLLYTSSTGPLDPRTEAELLRVLDVEGRTPWVYIMGGTSAVPGSVDQRLQSLGITPIRIAGSGREATAALASAEVESLKSQVGFTTRDFAFVAFGRNFPDAVAAGQMAARYGIPVLVTNTEALHPETRAELERIRPTRVLVLGGTAVVSDAVVQEIRALGLTADRLAGPSRVDTALAVADAYIGELSADAAAGEPISQPLAVAVNLRTTFTDVLAASLIGAQANIFLPLDGADGSVLTDATRAAFCGVGGPLLVVGGRDTISDAAAGAAAAVVEGTAC
jgi:hypothetical protein